MLTQRSPFVTAIIATICKKLCRSAALSFSGVSAGISSPKVLYVSVTMVSSLLPNDYSFIIFNWLLASGLRKKLKKTGKLSAGTFSTLTPIAAPAVAKVKCALSLCSYPEGRLLLICISNYRVQGKEPDAYNCMFRLRNRDIIVLNSF